MIKRFYIMEVSKLIKEMLGKKSIYTYKVFPTKRINCKNISVILTNFGECKIYNIEKYYNIYKTRHISINASIKELKEIILLDIKDIENRIIIEKYDLNGNPIRIYQNDTNRGLLHI